MNLYGSRALTPCDLILVELLAAGLKNQQMAEVIGVSEHVIKNYLQRIRDKIGMSSRVEVALWWQSRHPQQVPREVISREEWEAKKIIHKPAVAIACLAEGTRVYLR